MWAIGVIEGAIALAATIDGIAEMGCALESRDVLGLAARTVHQDRIGIALDGVVKFSKPSLF